MNNTYLDMARRTRGVVGRLLVDRGLQPPARWLLAERNGYAWLIGVLPVLPSLTAYVNEDVTHSLKAALQGLPVIISNSTGLRYAVLLSGRPRLPESAVFPEGPLERDMFLFGVGYSGPIIASVQAWMHMIIAGAPGSGKSTFLRSIAHTARGHGWQIYLVDPDGATFPEVWNQSAAAPVASSTNDLVKIIERLEAEIARRAALFQEAARHHNGLPPENIDEYNNQAQQPLERIALIVDESNGYLGDKRVAGGLAELARRGRKWGMHLVLAGHNWRAADVSRELSAMLQTRICFRVTDDTSGKVVLSSQRWGQYAMRIEQPGRAVLVLGGQVRPVQTYRMEKAQEAGRFTTVGTLPAPLTDKEQAMVRCAVEELGGQFAIDRLVERLEKEGVRRWGIRQTAEVWELRGWLTRPADAVSSRMVTPELAKMAGLTA